MSKVLQINEPFKYTQDVFLSIRKASPLYQLHEGYAILDEKQDYVTRAYIYSIKEIKLSDIDNEIAILDKNVTADVHKQILEECYKIAPNDLLYKIVFSTQRPIINYD